MARKVSAQETTIQQEDGGKVDPQYECPICLNWLCVPILTSCGHRFCKKCIYQCLEKTQNCCPIDNKKLTETDLFMDQCTLREINNIRRHCPNAPNGCHEILCPTDIEAHLAECMCRNEAITSTQNRTQCPFNRYGCLFETDDAAQLDSHNQADMHKHLNMLLVAFTQGKSIEMKAIEATKLWDPPSKTEHRQNGNANHENRELPDNEQNCSSTVSSTRSNYDNDALLRTLYERIVVLEQLSLEQKVQIEKLTMQVNKNAMALESFEPSSRYSGILIWKITQFNNKVLKMSSNPNTLYYSPDVFTGPLGYRFCARINISQKAKDNIGLHVHMMRSNNDYHLDWPFRGCFKIWMIHPDAEYTLHDKIMSNEKILAFQRPRHEISPRGFGFIEYANISDIHNRGFVTMDTLTIKLHISIV